MASRRLEVIELVVVIALSAAALWIKSCEPAPPPDKKPRPWWHHGVEPLETEKAR
jgi:hypothetical protein